MAGGFLDALEHEVMLADGAMGTMLLARGVEVKSLMEQNLVHPDLVRSIHLDYIRAGARLIETNTFLANRLRLAEYGLEHDLEAINRAGVRVAREAVAESGERVFVAGSVGPLGALVRPYGNLTLADLAAAYTEQMAVLVDEGVDVLIIETHPSLLETLEAIRAAKTVSPTTPLIAQMTFLEDGRSKFGDELRRSLEALAAADADVVGVNCSGPQMTYDILSDFLSTTDLRVSVMPNAGLPQFIGGRTIYLSSPEYLREYARRFVEAGASIVGGCCGTTPEHIRAMATVVHGQVPRRRRPHSVVVAGVEESAAAIEPGTKLQAPFREKLSRQPVVTVEINPPKGVTLGPLLEAVEGLLRLGVDAVSVTDHHLGGFRLSSLAVAHLLQVRTGREVILQYACRDRSLTTIHAELLGAAALGIRNILALTGEAASGGELPRVPAIHEVNATGLVKILDSLNHGYTMTGAPIGSATDFLVGVLVNPAADDLEAEVERLRERRAAGAHFAQTHPVYDLDLCRRFLQRCQAMDVPLLITVLPLKSWRHAEFLHHEVPGILIPDAIRERMRRAEPNALEEGMALAAAFVEELRSEIAGVHIIPPTERPETVAPLVEMCVGKTVGWSSFSD
jgi:homocysteine S-methyltransferase